MNLVQLTDRNGARRVAVPSSDGSSLHVLHGKESVRDLAFEAVRSKVRLDALVTERMGSEVLNYDTLIAEKRLLSPIDHPDPAHCIVTGTGLTHLGSARSRDAMHAELNADGAALSDSMRMFKLGLEGGKPLMGELGVAPEWFYKGDGSCVVAPEHALDVPPFAEDGGEEAELVGIYVISETDEPLRVGFAVGNEFSDHALEKRNYLYLAHSKLRPCSIGPELYLGALPEHITGKARILREGHEAWSSDLLTGEANMSHAIANLEHHHFKYDLFRRPGDVHLHFFGASALSSTGGFAIRDHDVVEIELSGFGRSLRNPIRCRRTPDEVVSVKVL